VSEHRARRSVARARRIVVKVGSSVLTRDGALRATVFSRIAKQVAALHDEGRQVVLVSSGAIAIGSRDLGWSHPGRSIPEKQAAAAVGQIGLVEIYKRRFARLDKSVAQVLVTRAGLENRERFMNARHTLATLLRLGVVPIVNENDTVATEEIRFGDNDNLAGTIVNLVAADLLVILTDVIGLYREPPTPGQPRSPIFGVVDRIGPDVLRAAQGATSAFGRGGMTTKLEAARAASRSGAATVLCSGLEPDALVRVAAGEDVGTLFPAGSRMKSRKHWLAYTATPRGRLRLDPGAVRALMERGRSLLPAGISGIEGRFGMGDLVACLAPDGREIARGLSAYDSAEVDRIKGLSTKQAAQVLGYSNGDEVIHRDDLVLVEPAPPATGAPE
jgi:glutamate 5-kinase